MRESGYDAVVLTGGRGSRLGGVAKAQLLVSDGGKSVSLLQRTLSAVADARRVVVVGDRVDGLPPRVRTLRETPAFGGPVAALAAGLAQLELDGHPQELVLVLACDMPEIGRAVSGLLAAAASAPDLDGVLAIDATGQPQFLAAAYRFASLRRRLDAVGEPGVDGLSMRAMLRGLRLGQSVVPPGSTDDVDDWDDAVRMGVSAPPRRAADERQQTGPDMGDEDLTAVRSWADEVASALGIVADLELDELLAVAGLSARAAVRPAAPVTTYLLGLAVGRAAAEGADPDAAFAAGAAAVRALADSRRGTTAEDPA